MITMTASNGDDVGDGDNKGIIKSVDDLLSESMILLDPPPLLRTASSTSLELGVEDVRKAHVYLMSACEIIASTTCNGTKETVKNHSSSSATATTATNHDVLNNDEYWVRLLCDVYRAMIVCSHLLLEMDHVITHGGSSSTSTSHHHMRNIRKCILLLYHLALTSQVQAETPTQKSSFPDLVDWNGQGLPSSPYGMLQECFQGVPLMVLDSNSGDHTRNIKNEEPSPNLISFGSQAPLISLRYYHYIHHTLDDRIDELSNTNNDFSPLETNDHARLGDDHSIPTYHDNAQDNDALILTLDKKQLAKEESYLLSIALPNTTNASQFFKDKKNNHHVSSTPCKNKNHHIPPPSDCNNNYQKNENKKTMMTLEPTIIYQGTLLQIIQCTTNNDNNNDEQEKSVYVQLLSNGLIAIASPNNNSTTKNKNMTNTDYYLLTPDSRCRPIVEDGHLIVDLRHIILHPKHKGKQQNSALQFRCVDESLSSKTNNNNNNNNSGNILSIGYAWISSLENVIANIKSRHESNDNGNKDDNCIGNNSNHDRGNKCIQQLIYKEWRNEKKNHEEEDNDGEVCYLRYTWTAVAKRRVHNWWHNELSPMFKPCLNE